MNWIATIALFFTLPFLAACATTPLNEAIARKDFAEVKRLVDGGADIKSRGNSLSKSYPLAVAVRQGTPEIANYLAKKGAGTPGTGFFFAAGNPDMLDALLDGGLQVPSQFLGYRDIQVAQQRYAARATPRPHGNLDDAAYDRMRAAANQPPEKKEPSSDVDAPSRRGAERPNDFALVIGIEEYQSLPKAEYGARDAKIVRKHFEAIGVPARNIISLEGSQATGSKLRSYLQQWLPRNVKPDSTVFVYYSGHGAPDPENGDAYLVPWDADPMFLTTSAYPLKQFYSELAKLKAKRVVVALDACFSGSGGRSVLAKGARPLVSKVDESLPAAANLTVLAAASGSEITGTLDDQAHGIFTYYFLKGLSGGAKTPRALFDYLKPKVQDDARRQNREQSPTLNGSGADAAF